LCILTTICSPPAGAGLLSSEHFCPQVLLIRFSHW
jgi:hypothetical protein